MSTMVWILLLPAALAFAALIQYVTRYLRLRGERVVTCPETRRPAGVELDTRHAAWTSVVSGTDFRLSACSRWPERAGCAQECLAQVEDAPQECLARTILGRWYADRNCVFCGRTFGPVRWRDLRPSLRDPDGQVVDWSAVPTERIPQTLETHGPVCRDCAIADSFHREHPERVVDRARR